MAPMSSTIASVSRKSFRLDGTRGAEQREHADRERDVGGHRDGPAVETVAAEVDGDEQQRGHDHAAERGDGGQRGAVGGRAARR